MCRSRRAYFGLPAKDVGIFMRWTRQETWEKGKKKGIGGALFFVNNARSRDPLVMVVVCPWRFHCHAVKNKNEKKGFGSHCSSVACFVPRD